MNSLPATKSARFWTDSKEFDAAGAVLSDVNVSHGISSYASHFAALPASSERV